MLCLQSFSLKENIFDNTRSHYFLRDEILLFQEKKEKRQEIKWCSSQYSSCFAYFSVQLVWLALMLYFGTRYWCPITLPTLKIVWFWYSPWGWHFLRRVFHTRGTHGASLLKSKPRNTTNYYTRHPRDVGCKNCPFTGITSVCVRPALLVCDNLRIPVIHKSITNCSVCDIFNFCSATRGRFSNVKTF